MKTYEGFLADFHPATKIFFSILMILVTFIAFFLGGLILGLFIFDVSFSEIQNISNDTSNIGLLKYLQVLQSFSLFIIPSVILSFLFKRNGLKYLYLDNKPRIVSSLIVISLIILSIPFINYLAELNSKLNLPDSMSKIENWMKTSEQQAMELTEKFLKVDTVKGLLFNIFMIALLPAIGEEFFFRGIFQRLFCEWTKSAHAGIFISAFLFSSFHLQFYGFLPRLILGIMLGYFLVWSKSLWLPILAHFINNLLAVLTYYFITIGAINPEIEKIGSKNETIYLTIISFCFFIFTLYLLNKTEKKYGSGLSY